MDLTYCILLWDESEMSGQEEYIWGTFGIHLEYIWEKYISDVHLRTFAYICVHPHPEKKTSILGNRDVHLEYIWMYIWSTFAYIWRIHTSPYIWAKMRKLHLRTFG